MTAREATAAVRAAGIVSGDVADYGDRWIIRYYTDTEMTFGKLEAISEAFGTKRIDLGIDEGCPSDPTVDPYIVVWK